MNSKTFFPCDPLAKCLRHFLLPESHLLSRDRVGHNKKSQSGRRRKRVRDKDKKKSGTEEIAKRSLHRNKFSRDESESGIISSRHKDAFGLTGSNIVDAVEISRSLLVEHELTFAADDFQRVRLVEQLA